MNGCDSSINYRCDYCNHEYRTRDKYSEHIVFCEFSHKTKREQEEDIEMFETMPTQKHMFLILKQLALRVDKLERENEILRNVAAKANKKINILEWLNKQETKPSKTFKEWVLAFDYENTIKDVFQIDIPTAIIHTFERGVGELTLKNIENIPIRVFLQKKNIFYVYGKEKSNDPEPTWYVLSDDIFDKWIDYMMDRFLMVFPIWFEKQHKSNPAYSKELEDEKNGFYKKLLGGKITEESRNQRVRHGVFKSLQKNSKMISDYVTMT
uniref:Uncharacterized protein n=1 Tax=viral metagenome TaxID=1070528 RepID=A0A6C0DRK1_9ZZZZ